MSYYEPGYNKYRDYKFNSLGIRYRVVTKVNGLQVTNYFSILIDVANFINIDVDILANSFGKHIIHGKVISDEQPKFTCIIDKYTIFRETNNRDLEARNDYKYIEDPYNSSKLDLTPLYIILLIFLLLSFF